MSRYPFESPELHFIPLVIFIMLVMGFLAVLFLQSGIDKVVDRKGNLGWLTEHFAKSPLAGMVPFLLTVVTILELVSGGLALVGFGMAPFVNLLGFWMPLAATCSAAVTLLVLFSGQRLAKDYAGAAGIVPYYIFVMISLLLSSALVVFPG